MIVRYWALKNDRRLSDSDVVAMVGLESILEYLFLCGVAKVFFK